MIKYPNGSIYDPETKQTKKSSSIKKTKKDELEISISAANRGMNLENDINLSCEYYREKEIALIYKRPTPINVVKVDYTHGAKITNAYFETQSTTDYNGVYKGRYIDFEAKNTKNRTSFPLANIPIQQINHLKLVIKQKGIAFFVIQFQVQDEVYLLDAKYVIDFYENGDRKSIPYQTIKEKGILLERGFSPRIHLIEGIEKAYFEKK